jgi:membrane-bound lytic murein transglycosylase F
VKDRLDARESILGGARYFTVMWDTLPPRIKEPDRTFLTLAAYNMGIGHLEDARILAQRSGLSPDSWLDVKRVMPKMSEPGTYKDLKHGFARGYETLQFVDNVRNYYDILSRIEPREAPIAPREPPPDQSSSKGSATSR